MEIVRNIRGFAVLIAIFIVFYSLANLTSAQPNVEIVSIEPEEPTIGSDFTVKARFDWNNISKVVLYVDLCSETMQMCFASLNTEMIEENGIYTGTVKIEDERTTYIDYRFSVTTLDGESYELSNESWKVNVRASTGNANNTNTNANDKKDKGIPGFELAILLISLSVVILVSKRKRWK